MYKTFKNLIDERGLTTYKVSKDTGLSQTLFSDWKAGKSTPKVDKLIKLSKYFGVPLETFLNETKENAQ